MLIPKRVKHRKQFRGRMKGRAMRGNTVSHGEFGLVACEPSWITNRQIEAARIAMTRYIKRGGKVWIKIFPDKPITAKPAGTRMGSGKGSPEYWVAVVQQVVSCLKWTVCQKLQLVKLCVLQAINFQSNANLLLRVKNWVVT